MNSAEDLVFINSPIQMQAVVEAPYFDDFSCPWNVPEFTSFSLIPIHPDITYPEIELIFAQLAQYNQIELVEDKRVVLKQIIAEDGLILPGGIRVIINDRQDSIEPGCCCGLETWREWFDLLQTGNSPWLGHDPSPWIELKGEIVRIWSDGGIEKVSDAFAIEVRQTNFIQALMKIERDLQAFLVCIDSWTKEIGFEESNQLVQKFALDFDIGNSITLST